MSPAHLSIIEWYAAIAAAAAALVVALDLGRRATGAAFILFCTSSVGFITYGLLDPQPENALATLNFALLGINLLGVWQYLLSPKNKKKMAVAADAIGKAEAKGEM